MLRQTPAGACGGEGNVDGLASVRHPEIIYRLVETPSTRKTPGVGVDSGRLFAWKAAHGGPILAEAARVAGLVARTHATSKADRPSLSMGVGLVPDRVSGPQTRLQRRPDHERPNNDMRR